jgi:hypothetical protein
MSLTAAFTLQIGKYTVTFPAGSFNLNANGTHNFNGVINGVSLSVQIAPTSYNSFAFKAERSGADLSGITHPVTVVLTIGDDSGSTTATAQFK